MHYAGDAVLAMFEAVVDEVSCATAIQEKLRERNQELPDERKVQFRIGVNLGDVIEDRGDIYGDGVNVAARLESLAEPGGICIAGAVHDAVGARLPLVYEFMGEQSVKNIKHSVRAYRVLVDSEEESKAAPSEKPLLELPDKPSIAVLPFTNMSGDPEQEYFSDGISEDIITELSRFPMFFVIARNSSFLFKGQSVDMKEIGSSLGVRYVLEGSVRKSGQRVRVTAQLVEAETGNHLWADRYDRELEDIFAVQDEVTQTIVSMLAVRVEEEKLELAKRKSPQDLQAYDLWLRGKKSLDHWTAEGNAEASHLFAEAIAIDPTFARAHAGLAAAYEWATWYSAWNETNRDLGEAALQYAQKAVEIDDTDYQPHTVLAWIYLMRREYERSRRHLDSALARNPNDADNLANRAMILTASGEPEAGRKCAEAAIRLNPHHPDFYLCFLGASLFFLDRYEDAIAAMEQAPDGLPEVRAIVAAACALVERTDDAREHIGKFVANYSLNWKGNPSAETIAGLLSLRRQRDTDLLLRGLRKAGLD